MPVFHLTNELIFPPPQLAEHDGLLAVGGDLSEERLLLAYRSGIFPWYSEGEPILWWSPSPRLILEPRKFHLSKRLARTIRQKRFSVTIDTAFPQVIRACATSRTSQNEGTWITNEMIEAYCRLHESGYAHSVECRQDGKLVGGLYGIALGSVFFGESMFSHEPDASKIALKNLVDLLSSWRFDLIDCQIATDHLKRMGAEEMPGEEFLYRITDYIKKPNRCGKWSMAADQNQD